MRVLGGINGIIRCKTVRTGTPFTHGLRMASVSKHGKRWRAQVAIKGRRTSKVFDSKNDATLWAIEQETVLRSGKATVGGYTLSDAFDRYAKEVSPEKKGERWEIVRLKKLSRDRIGLIPIDKIEPDDMQDWIGRQTISAGSVLRELNLIQSVIKQARKWRWTNSDPFVGLEKPQSPKHRERLITDAEIAAICKLLPPGSGNTKSHQVVIVMLIALETAMRKGEILKLEWQHVHHDRAFVHLPHTKNGKSRDVPLSRAAIEIFNGLEPQDTGKVFTVSSDSFDQLFRKLKTKAGVEGFTFHDTRHTAVTRLASKLSVLELARMVGHSDPRSLMWYYNATAEQLAAKLD